VESTSPQVMSSPQASSPTPIANAPASVASQPMSAPSTYQASPQAPAPQYQASAPAPQVSAPQGNPWQEAFQALSQSLNTSSQYQAPATPSAYQTPTPQVNTQAQWASTQQVPQAQYSAAPTYQQGPSVQELAALQAMQAQQQAVARPSAPQAAPRGRDNYLKGISNESLEVLQHFGPEAPVLLNNYACAIEDALIEQVQRGQQMGQVIQAAGEERGALRTMLTDPDILADYVNKFYGPEGPYPTELPQETTARQQAEARAQFEQEIIAQEKGAVPQNFQRPQMEMPTPGRSAAPAPNDFWGNFSELMDNSPERAWQYLSQAPQGMLQTKMLIQDA
jgi:hypothetical protein